jgi:hypothetical protein
MSTEDISEAITKAEKITQKVAEALRPWAFQTVLNELLQRGREKGAVPRDAERKSARKGAASTGGSGTTARLLGLAEEGVFVEQRSLSEIRQILGEKGFHYSLEELGTPLTRMVRRRDLRRVRVAEGGKKIWRYSNY